MTVRRALVTKSDEAIKEYTDSDKDQIHKRIARCYADNPTVYLSVVSSSGNLSPVMNDTRYRSGPAAQSTGNQDAVNDGAAEYPQDDDTGDPEQIIENSYDKISQTRTDPGGHPSYYDWAAKPVYMEYDNSIREMSFQDVMDTFIDPVVDKIQLSSTDARAGGTFFISTATSHTNCSDLGIVFVDTVTDTSIGAGLSFDPAVIGDPNTYQSGTAITQNTFRLFKNDGVLETYRLPLVIDKNSNGRNNPAGLREMTQNEFHQLFCGLIRAQIYNGAGHTLEYNINGIGTAKGTSMTNSELTGVTGDRRTRFVGTDDYRAQEFPTGTVAVVDTWTLRLNRT
tara:strand:+ start:856 stop:1872 length:1017 start_codon:yes stop_codon:yes gene_type:complete